MQGLEIWNRAISVSRPTARDIDAIVPSGSSRAVFAGNESFRWLAPNILYTLVAGARYVPDAEVVNIMFAFSSDHFRRTTEPGIFMTNVTDVRWGELVLPCDAARMLDYVKMVGGAPINLMTETDYSGEVAAWNVRVGALTFEFTPTSKGDDPKKSYLLAASFNFRLRHVFPLAPNFFQA